MGVTTRDSMSAYLWDGCYDERLHAGPGVVAVLLTEARVNHVLDPVNRQWRLRNVGRQDNLGSKSKDLFTYFHSLIFFCMEKC